MPNFGTKRGDEGVNQVELVGNIAKAPVESTIEYNGNTVTRCFYVLAVGRWKQNETDFIGCVAIGRKAEYALRNFRVGTSVAVVGRLYSARSSKKEEGGKNPYYTCVNVRIHEFAGYPRRDLAEQSYYDNDNDFIYDEEEDCPFPFN